MPPTNGKHSNSKPGLQQQDVNVDINYNLINRFAYASRCRERRHHHGNVVSTTKSVTTRCRFWWCLPSGTSTHLTLIFFAFFSGLEKVYNPGQEGHTECLSSPSINYNKRPLTPKSRSPTNDKLAKLKAGAPNSN